MDDQNQEMQNNVPQPQPSTPSPVVSGPTPTKNMKFFIGVIIAGILLIIAFLVVAFAGSGNKPTPPNSPDPSNPVNPEGPQPANSLDVEQSSNAISEDLGGLNDDVDLPPEQLSDDNLDL